MKQTFTFIFACLIVTLLMGQTEKARISEHGKILHFKSKTLALKSQQGGKTEHHLSRNHPFYSQQGSTFKSALTSKEGLDSMEYGVVDLITGQMGLSEKDEYTYNSIGNMTQEIEYGWDETVSQWVASWKYEFTYNATGEMIQEIDSNWDETAGEWVVSWKYDYVYDSNGNMTEEIEYGWDETVSQWVASWKYEFTYNATGEMIQEIDSNGGETAGEWVVSWKYDYVYDSNGNMTEEIEYGWDETVSQWVASWKYEYTYDSNGNMTEEIESNLDVISGQWVVGWKYGYTYDSSENVMQEIGYSWDETAEVWVSEWKYEYTYDNSYTKDELLLPYYFPKNPDYFIHKLNGYTEYEWDINSGQWNISSELTLYYSPKIITGTNPVIKDEIVIYPNPVTDGFRILGLSELSTIILSDSNGIVWLSKELAINEYVSTSALPPGIYLIRINTRESSTVKKLIKK